MIIYYFGKIGIKYSEKIIIILTSLKGSVFTALSLGIIVELMRNDYA